VDEVIGTHSMPGDVTWHYAALTPAKLATVQYIPAR
jgi:hypothetical protein